MKQPSIAILVAAVAAAAPFAVARANDFTTTAQTGYFQQAAAMPKTNSDELARQGMHVVRTPLLWEIVTYDNPAGAQGPIREEMNPEAASARASEEGLWRRFYPIGDSETP